MMLDLMMYRLWSVYLLALEANVGADRSNLIMLVAVVDLFVGPDSIHFVLVLDLMCFLVYLELELVLRFLCFYLLVD